MLNCIVESATGRLISSTNGDDYVLPSGTELVVIPDDETDGVWDEATRTFIVYPVRIMKNQAFMARFTFAEQAELQSAARQDTAVGNRVAAWLYFVNLTERIDLDAVWVSTTVNQMETVGLIATGRAAEILADG